jgi:hypothetical protein
MIFNFKNEEHFYQFETTKLRKSFIEFMILLKEQLWLREQAVKADGQAVQVEDHMIFQKKYPIEICKAQYRLNENRKDADIELGNVFVKKLKMRK